MALLADRESLSEVFRVRVMFPAHYIGLADGLGRLVSNKAAVPVFAGATGPGEARRWARSVHCAAAKGHIATAAAWPSDQNEPGALGLIAREGQYKPGQQRIGPNTIRFVCQDIPTFKLKYGGAGVWAGKGIRLTQQPYLESTKHPQQKARGVCAATTKIIFEFSRGHRSDAIMSIMN